jgi:hypothetical protein
MAPTAACRSRSVHEGSLFAIGIELLHAFFVKSNLRKQTDVRQARADVVVQIRGDARADFFNLEQAVQTYDVDGV